MKNTTYFLGAGPYAADRVEHDDGTVTICVFNVTIAGHGNTAKAAAAHLADQLREIARLVEDHEGGRQPTRNRP